MCPTPITLFQLSPLLSLKVYGHKYGLIGRNGVGKTTFLKYLASKSIPGIPWYLQILHIEQEVRGGGEAREGC